MLILAMACRCELRRRIKEAAVPWIPERTVYMDYNATTPVDPAVIGAFERACRSNWGNPSSLHSAGTAGWNELEELKIAAEDFFGAAADGFHLCSSGTEALSTALFGLASRYKDIHFFTTSIEHQAVAHPLFHLGHHSPAAPKGYRGCVSVLPVDSRGRLAADALIQAFKQAGLKTAGHDKEPLAALVISPVNHETGSIQPVKQLAAAAAARGVLVVLDGVQAAARLEPGEWVPYADIFCISGHKLYAPKGTALLWKKPSLRINPLRFGGSQEGKLFPGTENIPGAAALAEALRIMKKTQAEELRMLHSLDRDGVAVLEKSDLRFRIESPAVHAPGVLCISLDDCSDIEKLIFGLNQKNICISRFSACTETINGNSKILTAMGVPATRSAASIRISTGRFSRRDDYFKLVKALKAMTAATD